MSVKVALATKAQEAELLDLWQLYMLELSEFRSSITAIDGRFRDDRLKTYFAYEDHWTFRITQAGEVAGFALLRKSQPDTYLLGEFFILRKFRGSGVASEVVKQLTSTFPGKWEIPFQAANLKGAKFWRKTISALGFKSSELSLPIEGQPDLPHDLWLSFTS